MSERKVLTKYFPPDFDPGLVPRGRRRKTKQITVRTMLPFNIQCTTCQEFIFVGRKFNARKEYTGEDYLGIRILRFYIKCTLCSSEITWKTDPEHAGYSIESGAKSYYDPMKQTGWTMIDGDEAKPEDLDPVKLLEEKQKQSMKELEQLQELEMLKQHNDAVNSSKDINLNETEEREIKEIFHNESNIRRVDETQKPKSLFSSDVFGKRTNIAKPKVIVKRKKTDPLQ